MKTLYKLHFNAGSQGELTGLFIADSEKIEKLISSGETVYFGEVLGKHSDICGPLEDCDITKITDNSDVLKIVEDYNLEVGFNPLHYIDENQS